MSRLSLFVWLTLVCAFTLKSEASVRSNGGNNESPRTNANFILHPNGTVEHIKVKSEECSRDTELQAQTCDIIAKLNRGKTAGDSKMLKRLVTKERKQCEGGLSSYQLLVESLQTLSREHVAWLKGKMLKTDTAVVNLRVRLEGARTKVQGIKTQIKAEKYARSKRTTSCNDHNIKLNLQLDLAEAEVIDLESDLEQAELEKEDLQKELDKSLVEQNALKKEIQNLLDTQKMFSKNCEDNLRQYQDQASAESSKLQDQVRSLEEKLRKANKEAKDAKNEQRKAEKEVEDQKALMDDLQERTKDSPDKEQLEECERRADALNSEGKDQKEAKEKCQSEKADDTRTIKDLEAKEVASKKELNKCLNEVKMCNKISSTMQPMEVSTPNTDKPNEVTPAAVDTTTSGTTKKPFNTMGLDMVEFEGHHYFFQRAALMQLTWSKADAYCKQINMKLVSIESAAETQFLERVIRSFHWATIDFWTSARYVNGVVQWTATGQPLTYTNWHPGNPKNKVGNLRLDCVTAAWNHRDIYGSQPKWWSALCYKTPRDRKFYICEEQN